MEVPMEKHSVVQPKKTKPSEVKVSSKNAHKGIVTTLCPKCSRKITLTGRVFKCPEHGTSPWE
jgi:exosome complex RNA-binding protein Csl4